MSEQNDKIIDLLENILTMQVLSHTELRHINHIAQKYNKGGALVTDLKKQTLDNLPKNRQEIMRSVRSKRP